MRSVGPRASVPTTLRQEPKGRAATVGVLLLAAVMLLTIFEGAGRKWLFAEYAPLRYAAYFSKDVLFVIAAYWGYKRTRRFELQWIVLCALLILGPSAISTAANSNVVGAALSFRAYLIIPLCAFLAAPLVRNFRDVERCAVLVALSTIAVAALGAYQYSLPKNHVLNRQDTGGETSVGIVNAGHVRAAGTFAYIGGMSIMGGFGAWAGMFLAFPVPGRAPWVRVLGAAAVVAGLVCAAVAMSRGGLMFWFVTCAGSLMLYLRASQVLVGLLALFAVAGAFLSVNPRDDVDRLGRQDSLATGLITRIQKADTFAQRATYVLTNLSLGVANHPVGEGLGEGQPGGAYAATGERAMPEYESEWGRIAYEIGPAGLLGVLLLRFTTGMICWNALRRTTNPHRRLVLATALPFFGIISLGWMAFNHVGSSAAWAVMALALAAVPTENQNRRA